MPGVIDQLEIRKFLAFGSGAGIEIHGRDLEAAVVRVRPSGIEVLGRLSISGFRGRRAAEWGGEYAAFLKGCGMSHLAATVLLPRQDVIVRQISLPGVAGKDLEAAIALQLDTLHPYGEDDVQYGWTSLGKGSVLIGIMRRSTLEQYASLFDEAGIAVACFTFSAGAIHGAIRMLGLPAMTATGFVAVNHGGAGEPIEIYGESPDHRLFSAEFDLPLERVAALAISELRLDPESAPVPLEKVLPAPKVNPIENDLSRDALPYAAALAGACPRLAPLANLLPPERRASRSRAMFVPTLVLAAMLLIACGALLAYNKVEQRQYLAKLQAEVARLEPRAARAAALDKQIDAVQARIRLLDEFRGRPKADLDSLAELTRLLQPPIWTGQVEMNRESVNISGEAEQAAALVRVLDGSPLFHNSEMPLIARGPNGEVFRLRVQRGGRK
jgi:Tfp pilus assembly protein PilN